MDQRGSTLADMAKAAGAGAVATVAMTGVMHSLQRLFGGGRLPPSRIVDTTLRRAGTWAPRPARRALTAVAHLGFGAALGPVFAALYRRTRRARLPAPTQGALFGLTVWASSYLGWLPALDLMPPAHRDRPNRQFAAAIAHLVYGGALAALLERLEPGRSP
jgi:hypothetical protein